MNSITLIENPSYLFWKKIGDFLLKPKIKNFLKDYSFPRLIDFLKWVLVDLQRPRIFHPYGLFFYVGLPGTGKTMFLTYELEKLRKKYGSNIYIGTNYGYAHQDFEVNGYEDIIKLRDKPSIIGYDEIQNDFDARNWANLDGAFSERITQSRKVNGLMILATAQRFGFVDKRLRELTHLVNKCNTILNRLTIATMYEPKMADKLEEGQYIEENQIKTRGIKYLVQTDKLRELYSSYKILENVKKRMELYKNSSDKTLADITSMLQKRSP